MGSATQCFSGIGKAEEYLRKCLATDNETLIARWFEHFLHYFPPLAYRHSPTMLSICKDEALRSSILKGIYNVDPELAHHVIAVDAEISNHLSPRKLYSAQTDLPHSGHVIIYSDKLSEKYVSSQECFRPIITELTKLHQCVLVADVRGEISSYYQSLAPCIHADTKDHDSLMRTLEQIRAYNPAIYMPITSNQAIECQINEIPIFSCHPLDQIGTGRAPDYRLRSAVSDRYTLPFGLTSLIGQVTCPVFPPPESGERRYPARKPSRSMSNTEIRFGAFCRLSKLSCATLTTWAFALRCVPNSKLYFSYIQTNEASAHYARAFFAGLGIDQGRIVFLPRLNTNDYLMALSQMDVVFGASPEQGGITCFDALMCNVPYVIKSSGSASYSASYALKRLGLDSWDVSSDLEFVEAIKAITSNTCKLALKPTREDAAILGEELQRQYITSISTAFEKILNQQNHACFTT